MNLPTDKIISGFYESSADCVKVIDTFGTMLSFNPNGLKAMEIDDLRDVIGSNWLSFWKGDMHSKAQAAFARTLEGRAASFEGYCPTFKGTPKWWQVSIVPLLNEYGEVQWILVVSRDVTEVRVLKEEVKALKAQLRRAASDRYSLIS